ncbi:phage tail tape measure protein [Kaustia mangrovi]|uniref:phage tail tape measure protein n=1 Tax=Kaustia mangrovi TaxID=2593653 RepID=UPI001FE86574|nr:hypothetical protein [Kaustia mangrovi]
MAETTDLQRLVVSLDANIKKYEKQLAKATGTAQKQAKRIETRFERMNSKIRAQFQAIGSSLVAGLGLGAGGALVSQLPRSIQAVTAEVAELGRQSQSLGITAEAFQELQYAARQARIPFDGLTDALKEMQLRADEFVVTGEGSAAEAFARIGFNADELSEALKDPPALLNDIINSLRTLDRAAAIRIADEIFGGQGGETLIRLLDSGANAISRLREEARDTGAVMDEELVRTAKRVDEQFAALERRFSVTFKKAILEGAGAVETMGTMLDDLRDEAAKLANSSAMRDVLEALGVDFSEAAIREAGLTPVTPDDGQQVNRGAKSGPLRPAIDPDDDDNTDPTTRRNEYDRLTESIMRRTEALVIEGETLGMTQQQATAYRLEQELINAAQEAGIELSPEQMEGIRGVAQTYAEAESSVMRMTAAQEELNAVGMDVIYTLQSGFSDLITGAASFEDALGRILDRLLEMAASQAFQMLLGGGFGGGGGLVGGLIGGLFADGAAFSNGKVTPFARGGVVNKPTLFPMADGAGLMGEAGPEAVMPLTRLPNGKLGVHAMAPPQPVAEMARDTAEPGGTVNLNVTLGMHAPSRDEIRALIDQINSATGYGKKLNATVR